jgi:hypothetical protein
MVPVNTGCPSATARSQHRSEIDSRASIPATPEAVGSGDDGCVVSATALGEADRSTSPPASVDRPRPTTATTPMTAASTTRGRSRDGARAVRRRGARSGRFSRGGGRSATDCGWPTRSNSVRTIESMSAASSATRSRSVQDTNRVSRVVETSSPGSCAASTAGAAPEAASEPAETSAGGGAAGSTASVAASDGSASARPLVGAFRPRRGGRGRCGPRDRSRGFLDSDTSLHTSRPALKAQRSGSTGHRLRRPTLGPCGSGVLREDGAPE